MADEGEEQAPVRIPLSVATTPRNADLTKDALLQNCFIDGSQMGNKYVVKRPGFYVGSEAITTGNNRGIYVNPNNPSGGVAHETQVWYVSNTGTLSSFSGTFSPPPGEPDNAEGFMDYEFSVTAPTVGAPYNGAISAYQNSTTDLILTFAYAVVDNNLGTQLYAYSIGCGTSTSGDIYGGDTTGFIAGTPASHTVQIKKEGANINAYIDAVLTLSIPVAPIPRFVSAYLTSETVGTGVSISGLQFI